MELVFFVGYVAGAVTMLVCIIGWFRLEDWMDERIKRRPSRG